MTKKTILKTDQQTLRQQQKIAWFLLNNTCIPVSFPCSPQQDAITPMPRKSKKKPDFETALAELETLVGTMEQGDISLEESLALFERGVTLTRTCQESLKEAEQKVQILLDKHGEPEEFGEHDQ